MSERQQQQQPERRQPSSSNQQRRQPRRRAPNLPALALHQAYPLFRPNLRVRLELMWLALSASGPAAAVRTVATPRGGHQHHASSQRAAVYDIGDLEVAAPETLTRRSRRRRRRRADDERPMTSTAIVLASSVPPSSPPGAEDNPLRHVVDAAALWEMIEPQSRHLADEDCAHLRASIDVLLAKVAATLAPGPACGPPRPRHPSTRAPSGPSSPTRADRRRLPPGRRSRRRRL